MISLFRLMTYNILDGGLGRESALLEVIRVAAVDVVVLQEVIQPDVLEHLGRELGMTPCLAHGPEQGRKVRLLSRLPVLVSHSHRPWKTRRNLPVLAEFEWEDQVGNSVVIKKPAGISGG